MGFDQRDLDQSVFVSLFAKLFLFWFWTVHTLSYIYVGSRDLASQWPAVHNKINKEFFMRLLKHGVMMIR